MQPIDLNERAQLAYERDLPPRIVPASAQVIGCIWIFVGGSQAIANALSVVGALTMASQLRSFGASDAQVGELMSGSHFVTLAEAFFVGAFLLIAVSVLGFVGGVGLLSVTDWGRRCTEWACWGEAVFIVVLAAGFLTMAAGAPTPTLLLLGTFLFPVLLLPLVLMIRFLRSRAMWEAVWSENRRLRRTNASR